MMTMIDIERFYPQPVVTPRQRRAMQRQWNRAQAERQAAWAEQDQRDREANARQVKQDNARNAAERVRAHQRAVAREATLDRKARWLLAHPAKAVIYKTAARFPQWLFFVAITFPIWSMVLLAFDHPYDLLWKVIAAMLLLAIVGLPVMSYVATKCSSQWQRDNG